MLPSQKFAGDLVRPCRISANLHTCVHMARTCPTLSAAEDTVLQLVSCRLLWGCIVVRPGVWLARLSTFHAWTEPSAQGAPKGQVRMVVWSLRHIRLCVTPWTVAHQAPLSMGFSRQECWSGLPFPSPGDPQGHQANPSSRPSRVLDSFFLFLRRGSQVGRGHPWPLCPAPQPTLTSCLNPVLCQPPHRFPGSERLPGAQCTVTRG